MVLNSTKKRSAASLVLLSVILASTGCHHVQYHVRSLPVPPHGNPPRELKKAILPQYVIEPPDTLEITAIHVVPRSPYRLRTLDTLSISVLGTLPDAPIDGIFSIQMGGLVSLGVAYGSVKVAGMTVEEAQAAIGQHLKTYLREPEVSVTLADIAAKQQIVGPHLVAPDGRVNLGSYGSVPIVGKTIPEAKEAIEEFLSQFLEDPEISLDVTGYNSKTYYVVTQGVTNGDGVFRFPTTGNETVLDAVSQINGLSEVASKKIWIARPGRNAAGCDQILPVNWRGITQLGEVDTNYQLLPGDRLYVSVNKLIAFDNHLAILMAPAERLMGFATFGAGTITRLSGNVLGGGGNSQTSF